MIRKHPRSEIIAVEFVLPADHPCAPVSVVGNFNDWNPHRHPLIRRPDGSMRTTVLSPVGTVLYFRYLGQGGAWFDEPDADRIDEHGSEIAV